MVKQSGPEPNFPDVPIKSSTSVKFLSTYLKIFQDSQNQKTVFQPVQALQICHRLLLQMVVKFKLKPGRKFWAGVRVNGGPRGFPSIETLTCD
jgi:hypothetical protein